MPHPHPRKSGQAIIFLMVVMVIGLLVVVWNFDLHRVISAKLRMRNAGDSAAMAAARWQGHTLNMIGDLNLIQAAIISEAYDRYLGVVKNGIPLFEEYLEDEGYLGDCEELHELRARLEFVGPLAAFAVAQQTAFNNGALPDPMLASNLVELAEDIRYEVGRNPYDNAKKEYADLLEDLAVRGVAVSSYALQLPGHALAQETFYAAIAQALAGWWCPMHDYRYQLENYEGYESWGKLDTEFKIRYPFDLELDEFTVTMDANIPWIAVPDVDNYYDDLETYLSANEVVSTFGSPDDLNPAIGRAYTVSWHVYGSSWAQEWPRPAYYNDETDARGKRFALRAKVRDEYNYLGAVAGIGMSAEVGRGILSSSDNDTVDLSYKAKAKVFGFLDADGFHPPYYFGFVFPCFEEVRLVHSDIGTKVLSGVFYEHVTKHLEPYLVGGPEASDPQCPYCRLLVKWEGLDRQEGLEWLDRAYSDDDNNPCKPEVKGDDPVWGDAGGGATGGS